MLDLSKPIIVSIPVTRIADGDYATYYISANGSLIYTGKAVVYQREITIRVDQPIRAYAWRLHIERNSQQEFDYNLSNALGDTVGIDNLIFSATISSEGGSKTLDLSASSTPVWRFGQSYSDFHPLTHIVPRLPRVPSAKFKAVAVNLSLGERYKVVIGENQIADSVATENVTAGVYSLADILEDSGEESKAVAVVGEKVYDIWQFDECPNMSDFYVAWVTPEGGWCCWPFNGSRVVESNLDRDVVTGFDGVQRVVAEADRQTFELHSEVLPNDYYNEILFGIVKSPFSLVYDVINDRVDICTAKPLQCSTRPSKSNRMESVSIVLESVEKEVII